MLSFMTFLSDLLRKYCNVWVGSTMTKVNKPIDFQPSRARHSTEKLPCESAAANNFHGKCCEPFCSGADVGCRAVFITLPETNIDITPENGWLEDDCFLLGFGLFSRTMLVSGSVIHQEEKLFAGVNTSFFMAKREVFVTSFMPTKCPSLSDVSTGSLLKYD